jgi:hypothetical protein
MGIGTFPYSTEELHGWEHHAREIRDHLLFFGGEAGFEVLAVEEFPAVVLRHHLKAAQVRAIVERYEGDAANVALELVDAANQAGGKDNITALFVAGPDFEGRTAATRPRGVTTRVRPRRGRALRAVWVALGIAIGMAVWVVARR